MQFIDQEQAGAEVGPVAVVKVTGYDDEGGAAGFVHKADLSRAALAAILA